MKSIEFIVPGKAVPYVRTTQKQKFVSKQYHRYKEYSEVIRLYYMKALSELRSKSTENVEPISTTCLKDSLMPSMESHTMTIDSASMPESYVKVKLIFE